jgi:hypothetical protein
MTSLAFALLGLFADIDRSQNRHAGNQQNPGSKIFSFLSLYFASLVSERFLKTALAGSKSYLFLCLFIFSETNYSIRH